MLTPPKSYVLRNRANTSAVTPGHANQPKRNAKSFFLPDDFHAQFFDFSFILCFGCCTLFAPASILHSLLLYCLFSAVSFTKLSGVYLTQVTAAIAEICFFPSPHLLVWSSYSFILKCYSVTAAKALFCAAFRSVSDCFAVLLSTSASPFFWVSPLSLPSGVLVVPFSRRAAAASPLSSFLFFLAFLLCQSFHNDRMDHLSTLYMT